MDTFRTPQGGRCWGNVVLAVVVGVVVVIFYYCDMGEDWNSCYTLKAGIQLTPRAIDGL